MIAMTTVFVKMVFVCVRQDTVELSVNPEFVQMIAPEMVFALLK
jgi:hypothetical protein